MEQYYNTLLDDLKSREKRTAGRSNALAVCKLVFFACIVAAVWFTVKNGGGTAGTVCIAISVLAYLAAI